MSAPDAKDGKGNVVGWKLLVGACLVLIEMKNHFAPSPNLLKPDNPAQAVGMHIAEAAIIAVGLWLIWSGLSPRFRKGTN